MNNNYEKDMCRVLEYEALENMADNLDDKRDYHQTKNTIYYNCEMESNFPDTEFVKIEGRLVPKKLYESDKAYRLRCEELGLNVEEM